MNTFDFSYIAENIGGSTTPAEWELIATYAHTITDGTILDIGTCEGRTAFALALAVPHGTIYTIDPTPNRRFFDHRTTLGLEERVHLIEKPSSEVVWDKPIQFLFHDGLHTYQGVTDDIEKFCPFVEKGRYCVFHDVTLYDNTVGKAIREGEGRYYRPVAVVDNIYIGKKL